MRTELHRPGTRRDSLICVLPFGVKTEGRMIRFLTVFFAVCVANFSTPAFADDCAEDSKTEEAAPAKEAAPAQEAAPAKAHACSGCAKGKSGENHWCGGCKKGFVDGKEVKCESCYKGKTGQTAWCDGCKTGYMGGEKIKCKTCYEHKANKGEACKDEACKGSAPAKGKQG